MSKRSSHGLHNDSLNNEYWPIGHPNGDRHEKNQDRAQQQQTGKTIQLRRRMPEIPKCDAAHSVRSVFRAAVAVMHKTNCS